MTQGIVRTPWDAKAFGIPTYEIRRVTAKTLAFAKSHPGHYTAKVDPSVSAALLRKHGFYYCGTLITPSCRKKDLVAYARAKVRLSRQAPWSKLRAISHGAFTHGRFHRDPFIARKDADLRYDRWLRRLFLEKKVLGLYFSDKLAGFIACEGPKMVLHALSLRYRGKGMAKYFWTAACQELFKRHPEISSSVSASNTAALSLYASLGFRFCGSLDVYHRMTR